MANTQPENPKPRSIESHRAALTESLAEFTKAALGFPAAKRYERPRPGAFSATEIVYHMLAVEELWQQRIENLLTGGPREFVAMDPDEDAARNRYNERDFSEGLALLTKRRGDLLAKIGTLSDDQFELTGMHSKYGEMSIHRMLETMEGHDRQHAAQLGRTERALNETVATQ